jgi:hypothetical protein
LSRLDARHFSAIDLPGGDKSLVLRDVRRSWGPPPTIESDPAIRDVTDLPCHLRDVAIDALDRRHDRPVLYD